MKESKVGVDIKNNSKNSKYRYQLYLNNGESTNSIIREKGINIVDCWMPDPKSRDIIGKAMEGNRENWIVQGHIGSTYNRFRRKPTVLTVG